MLLDAKESEQPTKRRLRVDEKEAGRNWNDAIKSVNGNEHQLEIF